MKLNYKNIAGTFLFFGAAQFILSTIIAESLYPGYNIYTNSLSSLGVGPVPWIFNVSVILLGATALIAGFLILKTFNDKPIAALLTLSGLGGIFVGLFPSNFSIIHSVAAGFAFFFAPFAAIACYRITRPPMKYVCLILGLISVIGFILYKTNTDFDLGWGMERIIVYPTLIWAIVFGGYLMAVKEKK